MLAGDVEALPHTPTVRETGPAVDDRAVVTAYAAPFGVVIRLVLRHEVGRKQTDGAQSAT